MNELELEEAINQQLKKFYGTEIESCGRLYTAEDMREMARCFSEWQKKKYAHIALREIHDAWQELSKNEPDIKQYPASCFSKGVDWKYNQMLDKAVDATVTGCGSKEGSILLATNLPTNSIKLKYDDKVKLLIIQQ